MKLRRAVLAVLVVLPPLVTGLTGWLAAATEGKKREAAAWDEYGALVTSQLYRDEAVVHALDRCRMLEAWARGTRAAAPTLQADAELDRIARENGWRP